MQLQTQYSVSISIIIIVVTTVLVTNSVTSSVVNNATTTLSPAAPPTQSTSQQSSPSFAIYSVSPITTDPNKPITITGVGFGSAPNLINNSVAGDGSVDTLRDSVLPSILINDRTENWGAGYAQDTSGYDHIGIYLAKWTSTTIVINGFGSLLGNSTNPSEYVIKTGDAITITIYGPNQTGITSYDTTVL